MIIFFLLRTHTQPTPFFHLILSYCTRLGRSSLSFSHATLSPFAVFCRKESNKKKSCVWINNLIKSCCWCIKIKVFSCWCWCFNPHSGFLVLFTRVLFIQMCARENFPPRFLAAVYRRQNHLGEKIIFLWKSSRVYNVE